MSVAVVAVCTSELRAAQFFVEIYRIVYLPYLVPLLTIVRYEQLFALRFLILLYNGLLWTRQQRMCYLSRQED